MSAATCISVKQFQRLVAILRQNTIFFFFSLSFCSSDCPVIVFHRKYVKLLYKTRPFHYLRKQNEHVWSNSPAQPRTPEAVFPCAEEITEDMHPRLSTAPFFYADDFIYLSCNKLHSSGATVSASLNSPIVPLQQTAVCARFAFHMFGPGKRELSLSLRTRHDHASTTRKTHELFRAYGGTVADKWHHMARTMRFSAHATTVSKRPRSAQR